MSSNQPGGTRYRPSAARIIFGIAVSLVTALCALSLLYGGALLLIDDGSAYYVLAGLVLLAVAVLLWRRPRLAKIVCCLFIVATALWSFWEVGTDPLALLPRLAAPIILGLAIWAVPDFRSAGDGWRSAKQSAGVAGALAIIFAVSIFYAAQGPATRAKPGRRWLGPGSRAIGRPTRTG